MMNTKTLAVALLISSSSIAHAGFFDSLFGNKEEAPATEVKTEAPAAEVKAELPAATPSTMETATNMAMGLLPTLTQQLGVTDTQAEGGMGSLMQLAKGALSSDEFGQLSGGIPGMDTLLAAAPALSSGSGNGMSGMLSSAGGLASSIGGIAQLTQQFEALGLSSDMIAQFANIAISYFSQDDGSNTGDLLQKGLSSILGS